MKTKEIVGAVLILTLFVFGCIYLFGLVDTAYFPYAFFMLSLLTLVTAIFSARTSLDKSDIALAVILAFLVAGASSVYASTMKNYQDISPQIEADRTNLANQIDYLQNSDVFYTNLISNLKTDISSASAQTAKLDDDIKKYQAELDAQINAANDAASAPATLPQAAPVVQAQAQEPQYAYLDDYYERGENDD